MTQEEIISGNKAKAQVGDKIWFAREKRPYTVKACDERFIICTKPHFATVMYTIIDLQFDIRGTENLIFCMGFETTELCDEALLRLQTGESEVSYRNRVELDIVKIKPVTNPKVATNSKQ